MSLATLLWIVAVSGLVTGVAGSAAAALRRLHRPERWVWLVALVVTAALPLLPAAPSPEVTDAAEGAPVEASRGLVPDNLLGRASAALPDPARTPLGWIPPVWGAMSVTALLLLFGSGWALARRRKRWPRRRVDGSLLRVSDDFGPAVVGWVDPEIVLPAWALEIDVRRRRMIVRHEDEHRWARDPQLLALGVVLLATAPWNPFAWLHFRGLRRAIEFDCDARVLRTVASPRAYARLLLAVQLDRGRGALFAPALREPASFLERRLQMITLRNRPIARLRVAGLTLLAAALTVVACEAPRPTDPGAAEVGAVEATATVTATESDSLTARADAGEGGTVHTARVSGEPLILVDGVEYAGSMGGSGPEGQETRRLNDINPADIENIEVIKGVAALERWGEAGADGVILITTRSSGN
ncbi:MAG: M56 family metallopeptidase [Longimicrobiales bacterium]|nr:M56 family metallopeptidase [Longimicrobiales bacterium]